VTALPSTLHRNLHERNVDLVIAGNASPIADERLGFEFLLEDSYVIAAGAQCPWARRRRIELAELVNYSWVLPPSMAMEAFRARGLDYPRTTVVTESSQVRMTLLATGRFVGIFRASSLRFLTRLPEFKVLPIELPMARVPVGIVTLKNRTLSPTAQLFIEHAREVAKPWATRKS